MSRIKLRRGTFQHIESELFAYHGTRKEIERLREEILSPFAEEVNDPAVVKGKNSVRMPGDPTGRTATILLSHKKLEQLTSIAEAIESVVMRLPADKRGLVQRKYWAKPQTLTWDGIARELNIHRATALRWRDEIVWAIATKLGWR